MTVKELITELLNYDMDETVDVSLDNKEKVTHDIHIENWHGIPTIHFNDWRKKE